jgi:putative ABC transport system permease protein
MLASIDLRRHWRSALTIALLIGVTGAIVLATAAGARRSGSALHRFVDDSRTADLQIDVGHATPLQLGAFARTRGVASMAVLDAPVLSVHGRTNLNFANPVDERFGTRIDRARVVAGRRASPNAVDEVTIGEGLAAKQRLDIGDVLKADSLTPRQMADAFAGHDPGPPAGPRLRFRVVGIVRRPLDLGDLAASGGVVVLTAAFHRAYEGRVATFSTVLRVRTRHPATDVPRVSAAARRMFGNSPVFDVTDLAIESRGAHDAIDVLTLALWIFAGVAALAGCVAIAIVLVRDASRATHNQATLATLGLTHGDRLRALLPRAVLIAGGGTLIAVVGAVLASPLLPIGLARRADPQPGFHADWLVLAAGVVGVTASVLLISYIAGRRATRLGARGLVRERGAGAALGEMTAALPPAAANGARMALQPERGERAVPVRSAVLAVVLGVVGVSALIVFASSLDHLSATPRLYGWTFDFRAPDDTFTGHCQRDLAADFGLRRVPGVSAVAALCFQPVTVNGRSVTGWGFEGGPGRITPEIISGRVPTAPDEVALGSATLHDLHEHIGDVVRVSGGGRGPRRYRIVGEAAFPRLVDGDIQPLADGAAFTGEGLALLHDDTNASRYLVGRFASGVDRSALQRRIGAMAPFNPPPNQANFASDRGSAGPAPPPEVDRLRHIDWFAPTLAALLAVLAFIALAHALITAVRRRRRDLALLRTLGFRGRQVHATVAWQATTVVVIGLVVGLPTGFALGRAAWQLVAGNLGISSSAPVPFIPLLLVAPAAILLANLVSFVPGRVAARTRPAVALQSE